MPYPSRRYGVFVPTLHKKPRRRKDQYAVKMDDPNITIEEYIRLEEEKAHRRGKVFNWETATYAIVFNDTLTSEATLSCEPTVSSLNNAEIHFSISFDESDDEDCTTVYMAYPNLMETAYRLSRRYPVFIFNTVYTTYSLNEYSVYRYQYGVSWGMDMAYRLPVEF
ncbi:hypothetical protein Tco_0942489 [Tanacetum coccineum]